MLTEDQLADALRDALHTKLTRLDPANDLLDRVLQRDGPTGRSRRRRRRRMPAGGLTLTAGAALAILIAVGALVLANHHVSRRASPVRVPAAARGLAGELGVLRRPQTAAERSFNHSRYLKHVGPIVGRLTRLVRLPEGITLYLYVKPHSGFPRQLGFGAIRPAGGGGGACCNSATSLSKPRSPQPAGNSGPLGGYPTYVYFEIVPDGVASVRWVFPRQPGPLFGLPHNRAYATPLTVDVKAHDNVAAIALRPRGLRASIDTWYSAGGNVIASHRDASTQLNRIVHPPKPGPETPQSRLAERNPATPNPLHITPAIGSTHTMFDVRFTVLLNNGLYHFIVTGGPHAYCAPSYGGEDTAGTTSADRPSASRSTPGDAAGVPGPTGSRPPTSATSTTAPVAPSRQQC